MAADFNGAFRNPYAKEIELVGKQRFRQLNILGNAEFAYTKYHKVQNLKGADYRTDSRSPTLSSGPAALHQVQPKPSGGILPRKVLD